VPMRQTPFSGSHIARRIHENSLQQMARVSSSSNTPLARTGMWRGGSEFASRVEGTPVIFPTEDRTYECPDPVYTCRTTPLYVGAAHAMCWFSGNAITRAISPGKRIIAVVS